jgi:hypothetical protein
VSGLDLTYGDVSFQIGANYLRTENTGEWVAEGGNIGIAIRGESSPRFASDRYQPNEWTTESMSVSPTGVSGAMDGTTYVKIDGNFNAFPWLQLKAPRGNEVVWRHLQIEGDFTIPRHVDLISDRLIGFRQLGRARLPEIETPTELLAGVGESDQDGQNYNALSNPFGRRSAADATAIWSVNKDVLQLTASEEPPTARGGDESEVPAAARNLTLLRYERPLLEGEQMRGQFRVPESSESHENPPAYLQIANVLFCVTPDGVSARALTRDQPIVPWDMLEVRVSDQGLREGWNEFTFTRREGRIYFDFNQQPLIDFELPTRPRVAFGGDARHGVSFRSLRLSGPWPKNVPESWQR